MDAESHLSAKSGIPRGQYEGASFVPDLTARERQVLAALMHGWSNPQIATRLFISVDCVKFHLKNVYAKLGAERRLHAVRIAEQRGIFWPRS